MDDHPGPVSPHPHGNGSAGPKSSDPSDAIGQNKVGYSWNEPNVHSGVGRLDRSISRSSPSGIETTDQNCNGVVDR